MGEVDEVQGRMKVDIEAMMSMKKLMEVNAAVVVTTNAVSEVDPTPPSDLNQIIGKYGRPPFCASSEQACLPIIWLTS